LNKIANFDGQHQKDSIMRRAKFLVGGDQRTTPWAPSSSAMASAPRPPFY